MDIIVLKVSMGKITIMPQTTTKPYTLMGKCAGVAYNSNITDEEKCYKRGKQCVSDGHGRVLEFVDVYMIIEGYSTRCLREIMRHVGDGLTVVQRSTRYCNEDGFKYYIPPAIEKNKDALNEYVSAMHEIEDSYNRLLKFGIKKEDAANILPLGINTKLSMKKNARCLMDMSHVRLCNRALKEARDFMNDVVDALKEYSPEWKELAEQIFKPKCEVLGYCNEKFGCGKYPQKNID